MLHAWKQPSLLVIGLASYMPYQRWSRLQGRLNAWTWASPSSICFQPPADSTYQSLTINDSYLIQPRWYRTPNTWQVLVLRDLEVRRSGSLSKMWSSYITWWSVLVSVVVLIVTCWIIKKLRERSDGKCNYLTWKLWDTLLWLDTQYQLIEGVKDL